MGRKRKAPRRSAKKKLSRVPLILATVLTVVAAVAAAWYYSQQNPPTEPFEVGPIRAIAEHRSP